MFTLVSASIAVALACSDSVSPGIHGAGPGFIGAATDIQITPSSAALNQGGRAVLRCAAFDARGVMLSSEPAWTSSDAGVATVASDGSVSAQRSGSAVVTCQIGARSATSAITVSTAQVAFVEVTPGAGTLATGASLQLVGVARDSLGFPVPGSNIQWSSADTSVASVSPVGVVTARVSGDADIRAVSAGVAGVTKIKVSPTPPSPVAAISVSVDATSLNAGQIAHATATTTDANGQPLSGRAITWSTSNSTVLSAVTTSATKANVRALAQGTSTITATCEGQSASVAISVGAPAVASVATTLASSAIVIGQTTLASATPRDGFGNPLTGHVVTWSSLDPSIASVSSNGVVTGVGAGSVVIRAMSDGVSGDASLTVTIAPVASVTTTLGSITLAVGQTTQASAVSRDASANTLTGRYVAWSSLNPSVATVSISGVVTAVAPGSATIRATVESKTGDATVTVNAVGAATPGPTASVIVTIDSTSLLTGHSSQARFVAKDANGAVLSGKTPTWASQGTSIATVTAAGAVTGVGAGNTRIQATVDGIAGSAPLAVITSAAPTSAPTASVTVTIDSTSIATGHTAQAGFVAKDANGVVLTSKIPTWASQNPGIATVTQNGVITGVSAGATQIQATVDGIVSSAPLTVTASSPITIAPPSGSPTHPHEPSGFGKLAAQPFDALDNSDFYHNGSNISIVTDASVVAAGGSSSNVAQMLFPAGFASGSAPGAEWVKAMYAHPNSIYVSFFVKLSSNWVGNAAGANKILYWEMIPSNSGTQVSMGSIEMLGASADQQQLQPGLVAEGITGFTVGSDLPNGAPPTVRFPNNKVPLSQAIAALGAWHRYEVLLVNNTPGNVDGTVRWWLDGTLMGDYTNRLQFQNVGAGFSDVYWSPTYGGAGPAVPANQWMWLKDLYISGK